MADWRRVLLGDFGALPQQLRHGLGRPSEAPAAGAEQRAGCYWPEFVENIFFLKEAPAGEVDTL